MITEWLKTLGDTPDAVAASLKMQGVKGRRRSACNCPIANVVVRVFPSLGSVRLETEPFSDRFTVRAHNLDHLAEVPVAVQAFIRRFDAGDFQELVGK